MTPPEPTRLAWLRHYASTNPLLALWGLTLFCGGSVLLSYHANLAYLPDFSLVDLAGLMASVTLIGLMLIVSFLLACFVPGLTLRWIEYRWPLVPYRRYFTFTQFVCLWLISPAVWAAYLWLRKSSLLAWAGAFGATLFLCLVVFGSLIAALFISRRSSAPFAVRYWRHRIVSRHAVAFSVWIALFIFPIGAATLLATAGNASWEIPVAIWAVLLLAMFNGAAFAAPLSDIRRTIGIDALIALILVIFTLGLAAAFPQKIMQLLALGHRNAATLTVSGKNCHTLARFGVGCTRDDSKDGAVELENVNVLSRVGTTVLLELLVKPRGETAQPSGRTGTLTLSGKRPHAYQCDARLLMRAGAHPDHPDADLDAYRRDLVCVQITVQKSDILNIAFADGRQYSGYSGFALPYQTTD